ncbi:ribosome biogenesis regulatory protein-domain-containing protein, partial [Gorgonomyces haynaldii]
VSVERPIPLEFNLRLLEAYDMNPVESTTNEGLMEWTREGCQLLVNALFSLETESNDAGIFAKLPDAVHFLPRMKPVPKQKAQTRWEKFAAAKGIQKRKKVRVQYDENHGEYRPTWGYKNQGSKEKDLSEWIKEVPVNGDQTEDQYEKARAQKKERVEKNEMQQRRNTEEAYAQEKGKDFRAFKKKQLEKQIVESKTATASMGKFDNKIQGDNVKIRKQKRQVLRLRVV